MQQFTIKIKSSRKNEYRSDPLQWLILYWLSDQPLHVVLENKCAGYFLEPVIAITNSALPLMITVLPLTGQCNFLVPPIVLAGWSIRG